MGKDIWSEIYRHEIRMPWEKLKSLIWQRVGGGNLFSIEPRIDDRVDIQSRHGAKVLDRDVYSHKICGCRIAEDSFGIDYRTARTIKKEGGRSPFHSNIWPIHSVVGVLPVLDEQKREESVDYDGEKSKPSYNLHPMVVGFCFFLIGRVLSHKGWFKPHANFPGNFSAAITFALIVFCASLMGLGMCLVGSRFGVLF